MLSEMREVTGAQALWRPTTRPIRQILENLAGCFDWGTDKGVGYHQRCVGRRTDICREDTQVKKGP